MLTNNPRKLSGLKGYALAIAEQVPLTIQPNPHNQRYQYTKREKLCHLIESHPKNP